MQFEYYPNLQAVCSIGAGVDNIMRCPSLRPAESKWCALWTPREAQNDVRLRRVACDRDDQRWRLLGPIFRSTTQRNLATPGPNAPHRACRLRLLGYGKIGQKVAADLAPLGFPVMAWSRTAKPPSPSVSGFQRAFGTQRPSLARPRYWSTCCP